MSKFLNFSKLVINTKHITYVSKEINAYRIKFIDHEISGYLIFGGGGVSSYNRDFTICKNTDPNDYAIMEKWLNDI